MELLANEGGGGRGEGGVEYIYLIARNSTPNPQGGDMSNFSSIEVVLLILRI